jgi:hypothetical protein
MKILSVVVAMGILGVGATAQADEKKAVPAAAGKIEPVKTEAIKTEPVKPAPTPEAVKAAPAASGALTVEAKLCKNLQNREPVDVTDTFKIADGQVITFSRVTGGAGSEIHHVYFLGDKQLDDIKLRVSTSPFRTNSRKTLRADAGMAGDWRVEVRDANGAVLETLKFKVE